MELLTGLGCALVAITLIGHGIWVVLAYLAQALFGDDQAAANLRRPCPSCRMPRSVVNGRCEICGAVPRVTSATATRDELLITARQLARLHAQGAISPEQFEVVIGVVNRDLGQSLSHGTAPQAPREPETNTTAELLARRKAAFQNQGATSPAAPASENLALKIPQEARPIVSAEIVVAEMALPPAATSESSAPRPARSLADVLQSFMEESNIRWGEIIAGILIVISAVGLVFSLRATLQAIPYFPALLFMLFTVAFWGAGLYTLRRWKLHAVSRVILIISLLLVPLSFSAAIVMSGSGESQRSLTDPLFLLALAIGMSVFGTVTYTTCRELVGEGALRLTVGVLGTSLAQVLINRLAAPGMNFGQITSLAALPLLSFLVASGGQIVRGREWRQVSRRRAEQLFLVLGVATFALAAPLAPIVYHVGAPRETLGRLSPALSLAAAAVLGLGLLVHHRTKGRALATLRMAGTAVAIGGALLLLGLVALAWPRPELLVAVGVVNCTLLVALALGGKLPLLHAPAMACLVLAAVVGYHAQQGHLNDDAQVQQQIAASVVTGSTSLLLTLLAGLFAGSGWGFLQGRWREDGRFYFGGAAAAAGLSALVAAAVGFLPLQLPVESWSTIRHPDLAAPLLLFHAAALLTAATWIRRAEAAWAGAALLWLGLVYAVTYNSVVRSALAGAELLPARPVFIATLLHALLAIAISAVAFRRWLFAGESDQGAGLKSSRWKSLACPLSQAGAVALLAATPFVAWVTNEPLAWHAGYALLAMVLWCAVAALHREPVITYLAQGMFALAAGFVTAALLLPESPGRYWYLEVQHLHWQAIVLAGGAMAWSVLRRATSDWSTLRGMLISDGPAVDQLLLAAVVHLMPILALLAAWPGLVRELNLDAKLLPAAWAEQCELAASHTAWIALAVTLAAVGVSLWERVTLPALAGIAISLFAIPWLVATAFEPMHSVASAARWATALYGAAGAAVFIGREPVFALLERITGQNADRLRRKSYAFACAQPLIFGGVPVLLLTLLAVGQRLSGVDLGGPLAGSLFAQLGPTVSYAGPLLLLVAMLLAYCLRERQTWYALGGSLVFQLAANLAFLLYASGVPELTGTRRAAEWAQWNSLAAGVFGLLWLGITPWLLPREEQTAQHPLRLPTSMLSQLQLVVAAGLLAGIVAWAIIAVAEMPSIPSPLTATLGGLLSYVALALVVALIAGSRAMRKPTDLTNFFALFLIALVPLLAATADGYDVPRHGLAYHVLSGGWLAIGLLVAASVAIAQAIPRLARLAMSHWFALAVGVVVTALAIRGNQFDPLEPWWSASMVAGVMLTAVILGVALRSQGYAYASVVAAGLTVGLYWFAPSAFVWLSAPWRDEFWALTLLEAIVVGTGAMAGLWLILEIRSQRLWNSAFDPQSLLPPAHHLMTMGGLMVVLLVVLGLAVLRAMEGWQPMGGQLSISTLGAGISLLLYALLPGAAFWDRRATYVLPTLYAWGAIALVYAVSIEKIEPVGRFSIGLIAAAGYVALTGHLWSYGANLAVIGTRLGISDPVAGLQRTARWLPALSYFVTAALCLLSLVAVLGMQVLESRVTAAFAPGVAAWGLVCLAQEKRRDALQLAALLLVALSGVYLGWAQIAPAWTEATWLARVFRLLMVLAAATFMYGLILPRFLTTSGTWYAATRKAGFLTACAAGITFVAVLTLEILLFEPGIGAPVDDVQVAAVAVVLLGLIAGLLSLAVLPGRDPLLLSERGRMAYVYAAQATGVLLFVHLYVCKPLWFDGLLRPYWPFIVMAIAFVSVGLAELFHRTRIRVLAEPFERTGLFLPLLPALGWWISAGKTDYPLLLFTVGLLYVVLSITRRSWLAAAGAVLAGNGALWALLSQKSFHFLDHPQFWLIPPAASVLVAAQINRRRLEPTVLIAVRYVCMIVIYLSSTSEIFLRGGDSLWPPMILAALAVAGALLGIVLQIRAFLYLGSAFVLMAMISMVWHASRAIEHVWPWWAFGIGMGIAILVLFGIFEKQREEVKLLIQRLRQWEQ